MQTLLQGKQFLSGNTCPLEVPRYLKWLHKADFPVSADGAGGVWVSYNAPAYLAARHHLSDELRARLQGVEMIADAAVSP